MVSNGFLMLLTKFSKQKYATLPFALPALFQRYKLMLHSTEGIGRKCNYKLAGPMNTDQKPTCVGDTRGKSTDLHEILTKHLKVERNKASNNTHGYQEKLM